MRTRLPPVRKRPPKPRRRYRIERSHGPENQERWLVSYADLLTLLFAFFVVMYAISELDRQKLGQARESVRFAFGGGGSASSALLGRFPRGGADPFSSDRSASDSGFAGIERGRRPLGAAQEALLAAYLAQIAGGAPDNITLVDGPDGIRVRIFAGALYEGDGVELKPSSAELLDALGRGFQRAEVPIRIESHARAVPSGDAVTHSARRALSLTRYFAGVLELCPSHLSASAKGDRELDPDAPARVEIVLEKRARPCDNAAR